MKKSKNKEWRGPSGVSTTRPGGIVSQLRRLSTTAVIRISRARLDDVGDVGFERRVAALVLGDLRLVDPDDRAVRGGRRSAGRSARRASAPGCGRSSGTRRRRHGRAPRRRRRCRCSSPGRAPRASREADCFHHPSARPWPAASSAKRQSPLSDLRSRVAVSRGASSVVVTSSWACRMRAWAAATMSSTQTSTPREIASIIRW